jgi:hypothetical protein
MMDDATVDAVARMLADKCRAAANDPLGSSGFGATTSGRGAETSERRPEDEHERLLLREVAASQAEASAEAHIEAEAMWHMAREYEREGALVGWRSRNAGVACGCRRRPYLVLSFLPAHFNQHPHQSRP